MLQQHATQAQAVIKAGTVQLGGSVGYSQQNTDGSYAQYTGSGYTPTTQHVKVQSFGVSPSVGYFVADNLAIGLSGGYSRATTSYSYSNNTVIGNEQKVSQFNIGGYAQYYKLFTEQFGLVGTLGVGYAHGKYEYSSTASGTNNSDGFTATITPGIVFFPVPKFALGAVIGSLGYARTKTTTPTNVGGYPGLTDETYNSSSFGANFGISQLAFSGTYYFGR